MLIKCINLKFDCFCRYIFVVGSDCWEPPCSGPSQLPMKLDEAKSGTAGGILPADSGETELIECSKNILRRPIVLR
jgi:hypothetical protein